MSRRHLATAAGVLALVILTGCAQHPTTATPSSTATPTTAPAPAVTSTPTPVASFVPQNFTCDSILSPAVLAQFKKTKDFTLQGDFVARSRDYGGDLVNFVDYGGILCQWAYPSGDTPVNYAYSPITAAQAATQMSQLTDGGYVVKSDPRGTLVVNADVSQFPDTYLFINGYWFYGSDSDVLNLIVDNLVPNSQ
jgi:hypothetical protein